VRRRSELLLVTIAYTGFVASGVPTGMMGVAWPSVRQTFALPLDALGLLLLTEMIGNLLISLCGGPLIFRIGVGRVLLLSAFARGLGAIGYGLAPTWWLMVVLGVIAGAGGGALGVGLNTYFATNHSPAKMNWLHASYGLGAALGPAVMQGVLGAGESWRWGYIVAGLVLGLLVTCLALTLDRWRLASEETPTSPASGASGIETLKLPLAWAGIAIIFCFAGTEVTAGQWSYSLFAEARSIDPDTAAAWVSVYWVGSTVGRVVFGFIAARFAVRHLLRVAIFGAICSAALIWGNVADLLSFLGLAMLAFMLAPIFPLITSTTPERVGTEHGANVIGFQVAAASLGATFLPGLAGVLAERMGLEVIGPFLLAASVMLLLLHEVLARYKRDSDIAGV
jgi:fucose permease